MSKQSTKSYQWAFSTNKQSDYGTALDSAQITQTHSCKSLELVEHTPDDTNDEDTYGKGHGWKTYVKGTTLDTQFKRTFNGSSTVLGWTFALVTGNVVTSQPNAAEAPNVSQHKMKPLKPGASGFSPQLPATTVIEQRHPGNQKIYRDILCKTVEISGIKDTWLQATSAFIGSGHLENSAVAMPSLIPKSFLRPANVSFELAGQDISTDLTDLKFSFQNEFDEKGGYGPGCPTVKHGDQEYAVRSKCFKSGDKSDLSFSILLDTDLDLETEALTKAVKSVNFKCTGDLIESTYYHGLEINIPSAVIKAAKVGEENNLYKYDISIEILYNEGIESVWEATITNDTPNYLS